MQNSKDAVPYFEEALENDNEYVRRAAADELAKMSYEGFELPPKTVERYRKEISGAWAAAYDAVGMPLDRGKVFSFLLSSQYGNAVPNDAMLYVLRECKSRDAAFFTKAEAAALEGHYAATRSQYKEAVEFFRVFQTEGKWPSDIPALFIIYPDLIGDFGRALQYSGSGNEGMELFLKWEKNLENTIRGNNAPRASAAPLSSAAPRYRLLFFAGRFARTKGQHEQAILLFEQAMSIAPTDEQKDACIWYILDSSLSKSSDECIRRLEQLISGWDNKASYNNILERLSRELVSKREWRKILRVFSLVEKGGASLSAARYAWIVGRALEEGYYSAADIKQAAEIVSNAHGDANTGGAKELAAVFMRIAYDAGERDIIPALYYRMRSAAALGEPLFVFNSDGEEDISSPVLDFLLGFFTNNAVQFAHRFIKSLERELEPAELRILAEALYEAGMYIESIRLVRSYMETEGYTPARRDIERYFPAPFRNVTEKNAALFGIEPDLLFGLVRTESAFQSAIVSRAGAVGLSQLMPATAEDTANRIRRSPEHAPVFEKLSGLAGGFDLTNPDLNLYIGCFYFNHLMERFNNDVILSLMAYNGGPNRVRRLRSESSLPVDLFVETVPILETRDYGRKVTSAAAVYRFLYF